MNVANDADSETVLYEYALLKQTLKSAGIEIMEIQPDKNYPDMVYTANYGFVHDDVFIEANFKHSQRRGEEIIATSYFKSLGFQTKQFAKYIFFEGEGDLLRAGNQLYMGFGKRTMFEAKIELESILATSIIPLQLTDPYFYHLDTCFAPISESIAIINPSAFTDYALKILEQNFSTLLYTNEQDNAVLGCNIIVHNRNIVVSSGISESLKSGLKQLGYTVLETPMSQYIKGGGSVKCCCLIVEQ